MEAAAAYFSTLQPRKRIKVVESETAPKTFIAAFLWAATEGSEREALGQRIVEIPDDLERFESRDPRSTFTAYVPVGSLAKGGAGHEGRAGEDNRMRAVSRAGPQGARAIAKHRRALAELHVSPAL